jgi:hypothetical protein
MTADIDEARAEADRLGARCAVLEGHLSDLVDLVGDHRRACAQVATDASYNQAAIKLWITAHRILGEVLS